jgi:hypothetical protein
MQKCQELQTDNNCAPMKKTSAVESILTEIENVINVSIKLGSFWSQVFDMIQGRNI